MWYNCELVLGRYWCSSLSVISVKFAVSVCSARHSLENWETVCLMPSRVAMLHTNWNGVRNKNFVVLCSFFLHFVIDFNQLRLQDWSSPKSNVSMILIKGAGEKAFCAGGDIKGWCWICIFFCNFAGLLLYQYLVFCMTYTGADCKVSNTRMFQGQSFEGGTFEGQFVRWSVETVRELPSFLSLKRRGGQLLPQSSSLSQRVTYLPMTPFKLCRWWLRAFTKTSLNFYERKREEGNWEERCPNLNRMHLTHVLFCHDHLYYITINNSW